MKKHLNIPKPNITSLPTDTAKWSRRLPNWLKMSTSVQVIVFGSRIQPSAKLTWKFESQPPWIRILPPTIRAEAKDILDAGTVVAIICTTDHVSVLVSSIQMVDSGTNDPADGLNPPKMNIRPSPKITEACPKISGGALLVGSVWKAGVLGSK